MAGLMNSLRKGKMNGSRPSLFIFLTLSENNDSNARSIVAKAFSRDSPLSLRTW